MNESTVNPSSALDSTSVIVKQTLKGTKREVKVSVQVDSK